LPSYTTLDSLRVLALKADKPEAHEGDTITITPYISDVNGASRALTYEAEVCLDPGTSYGAEPTCTGSSTQTIITSSATAAVPSGSAETGASTTFSFSVPTGLLTTVSSTTAYNGLSLLVIYKITAATTTVNSFRRILIVSSSKTSLNSNPGSTTTLDVLFNGVASSSLSSLPSGDQSLSLSYGSGDTESYQVLNSDGTYTSKTEELTTTWFISDGAEKLDRSTNSSSITWSPPSAEPTSHKVVVAGVVRDGRGGIGFIKKEF
jgi:hypothetical protein